MHSKEFHSIKNVGQSASVCSLMKV